MQNKLIIATIVLVVIQSLIIATYNYHSINKNQKLWHRFQWFSWVLFYGFIVYLIFQPVQTKEFIKPGIILLLVAVVHWILFDLLLNIKRELPPFHRGKNFIDKYFAHPLVKLALLILFVLLSVFGYGQTQRAVKITIDIDTSIVKGKLTDLTAVIGDDTYSIGNGTKPDLMSLNIFIGEGAGVGLLGRDSTVAYNIIICDDTCLMKFAPNCFNIVIDPENDYINRWLNNVEVATLWSCEFLMQQTNDPAMKQAVFWKAYNYVLRARLREQELIENYEIIKD